MDFSNEIKDKIYVKTRELNRRYFTNLYNSNNNIRYIIERNERYFSYLNRKNNKLIKDINSFNKPDINIAINYDEYFSDILIFIQHDIITNMMEFKTRDTKNFDKYFTEMIENYDKKILKIVDVYLGLEIRNAIEHIYYNYPLVNDLAGSIYKMIIGGLNRNLTRNPKLKEKYYIDASALYNYISVDDMYNNVLYCFTTSAKHAAALYIRTLRNANDISQIKMKRYYLIIHFMDDLYTTLKHFIKSITKENRR